MALFDFLKFRKDKQGKKVAEAQQQIVSLQEAVFSLEKEKEIVIEPESTDYTTTIQGLFGI